MKIRKKRKPTTLTLGFDELHQLESDYPDYFEPMAIGADDKNRRRELSELLTDALLYFFSVFEVHQQYNQMLERALYEQLLVDKISDAVSQVTGIDGYISKHIRELAVDVVGTTYKNTEIRQTPHKSIETRSNSNSFDEPLSKTALLSEREGEPGLPSLPSDSSTSPDNAEGSEYWLSFKRAENIAKSEANTFLNYTDYLDHKEQGYTKKTWLTMLDPKVRDTHEEVEGQTIGIDESFVVGNSYMKFPHDLSESPDPKEVINCRCAVEYKK